MTPAADRTLPLELWPGSCEAGLDGLRCTSAGGHVGAHFDAAAARHFLVAGDAERIAREQRRTK
jgi:hypothetical protein